MHDAVFFKSPIPWCFWSCCILVSRFSDLSYLYVLFAMLWSRFHFSFLSLFFVSLYYYLLWVVVCFCVWSISVVFFFLLSLHIGLSSGFEFTRSSFISGSSILIVTVLLEREPNFRLFLLKLHLIVCDKT